MKISEKDKKLLLYTGGILTLLLVFVWFFKRQKANETLKAENEQLRTELAIRQEHDAKKEDYRTETAAMKTEIEDTLDAFPADIKEEDIIMYGVELERASDMEIANIGIGTPNQLYMLGTEKALNDTQVSCTFTASYEDFKKVVELIQSHDEKRNVENVILSFDAGSAKIIGSMNLNFYFMTGTDKEYQKPQVPNMPYGTDNIFGTVSSDSSENDAKEDEDTEE